MGAVRVGGRDDETGSAAVSGTSGSVGGVEDYSTLVTCWQLTLDGLAGANKGSWPHRVRQSRIASKKNFTAGFWVRHFL